MSLPLAEHCVSNPRRQLLAITALVVIVLLSPACAQIIGAYADAGAFLALLLAACGHRPTGKARRVSNCMTTAAHTGEQPRTPANHERRRRAQQAKDSGRP